VTITGSGSAKIGGATVSSGQEVIVAPGTVSIELTPASGSRISSVTVDGTTITSPASPITVTAVEGEPCVQVSATFAASSQPGASNPTVSNPTESNPTESNPTESNPTVSNPTASNPTESNPTESNPAESNPTASNPTASNPTESNPTSANPTVANPAVIAPTAKADRTAPAVYAMDFLDDSGGAITGTTTEMLYREKGSSTFAPCKTGSTPVVHPGVYYVHYPEGPTTKASVETEVVIGSYYTVTARHLYGKGVYYTDRPKLSGYENVFVVPSGETISFTFAPGSATGSMRSIRMEDMSAMKM
jgi:hypothetical protein